MSRIGSRQSGDRFGEASSSATRCPEAERLKRPPIKPFSTDDVDTAIVAKAYTRWAPIYDIVWGPLFERGRRAAVAAAQAVGGRILEVGVGTGLSLAYYSLPSEVFGVDVSEPMIAEARKRMVDGKFPHVRGLAVMDANGFAFPDRSFDCVVAQFVITLVADPEGVLSECARVTRPGGEIILVSHFYSERGAVAAFERLCARPARHLGLRLEFPFGRLLTWAQLHRGVELVEHYTWQPLNLCTLVRFRRSRSD